MKWKDKNYLSIASDGEHTFTCHFMTDGKWYALLNNKKFSEHDTLREAKTACKKKLNELRTNI